MEFLAMKKKMKKKGYGVFGEEERGLQNNLMFSISLATPKRLFFFFFEKNIKWPPKLRVICKMVSQSFNWYKVTPKVSKGHFSNLT
jgi:hypothetical protein